MSEKICFEGIKELETERLLLRKIEEHDVDGIFNIFSDPEVAEYDWFTPIKTKADALDFIKNYEEEFEAKEEITWGIIHKETKELIGICCLGDFNAGARRAEIGYDIVRTKWNNGYATEAINAVVHFGLTHMNLNRIEAFITPGNDSSVKVLEKLNFTCEGLVRERDLMKGKLEDSIIMAILKKDLAEKYEVVTLCGSTKFKEDFIKVQKELTLQGKIVISVGLFGHAGDTEVWDENTKEMLDDMHKRKIDMADSIFVINKDHYIGESTRSEIDYAEKTGKPVYYLERP